jgi:DNA repair photolyase
MLVIEDPVKSIINPTSGFLAEGFTHTINLYRGCALGNSLCGLFCYAQWNTFHTHGRTWGSFLDVKTSFIEAYQRDYDRIRRPRLDSPHPLRIYMSSVTDPYPPQERTLRRTRALLEEMLLRPPDLLVIQTHTPLVVEDLHLLIKLNALCKLSVNITVETDKEMFPPGFPRHMYSPTARLAALSQIRQADIEAVGVVSPLLPLGNPRQFAETLEKSCDRVILDHYLIGDGSRNGLRTRKSSLPELLIEHGFEKWTRLEVLTEVEAVFREVFVDSNRLGISRPGFNTI